MVRKIYKEDILIKNMKKWCSILVIIIFLFSIVDVNAADQVTGFSFKDVISKVVNSIKNVFSVAPVGGPIEDPNIITPVNLRAEVHNSEVTLTWNEGSSIEDVTKPVVTLVSPINNEAFFQNQLIQFSCTVSDNKAIDKVELWITDPVNGFHLEQTKRVQEETEDGPISTFRFSKSFAQVGQYAWNCKAYDKNDNNAFGAINDQSPAFTIRQEGEPIFSGSTTAEDTEVDTERQGPVVILNSPIDHPTYDQGARIEFSCSAVSSIQLRKIEFWVKDPTAGFNLDEIRESFPDETRYEARFNRVLDQEGGYEWNCKAYDINGNNAFGSVNGQSPGFNIRKREYNLGYKIYRINLDINQVDIIINSRVFFNCRSLTCSYTDRNLEEGNYRYYVIGYVTHNGVEKQSRSSNLIDIAVTSQPSSGGGSGGGGGGGGGGSGGGSGGGTTSCEEKWLCGGWSTCVNSQQTRSCVDLNSCKNTVQKISRPFETRACTTVQQTQEEFEQEQESQEGELEAGAKSVFARQLIGILTLLIIIGAVILIVFRKKFFNKGLRVKTDHPKEIDGEYKGVVLAVRSAMQNGFSSEEIKKELSDKGWTKDQINNILKRV